MKKLLSILASLVIASSSAAAVVACTTPFSNVNNNDDNEYPSGDETPSTDNSHSGGYIPNGHDADTPNNSNKGNNSNSINPSRNDGSVAKDLETVKNQMQKVAKSNILQDEFNINGDYLNEQLFNGEALNANGVKHDGVNGNASQFPLIDFLVQAGLLKAKDVDTIKSYLPLLDSISAPTPTQLGGLASQLVMLAGPLKSTLSGLISDPTDVKSKAEGVLTPANKAIIDNLIASDNKLDPKYDNLTLNQTLDSVVIGVAYILAVTTNDSVSAEAFKNLANVENSDEAVDYIAKRIVALMSAPQIGSVKFDDNKSELTITGSNFDDAMADKKNWQLYGNDTFLISGGQSVSLPISNISSGKDDKNTIVINFDKNLLNENNKYTLTYTGETDLNTSEIGVKDEKGNAISTQMFDQFEITFSDKLNDFQISRNAFNINKLVGTDGINVLTDIVKLLGMYISAFDSYKAGDSAVGIDNNHVFRDSDEKPLGNYEAVSKVRSETVEKQNYQFDILKFISDISYYLGKLDKQEGVYRLQAFLAMFFLDDNRSATSTFVISDNANKSIKSKNMTPLAKLVSYFMLNVLAINEPADMKNYDDILGVLGLDWKSICRIADESVYSLMQSMVWNRGFSFDGTFLPNIENGLHVPKALLLLTPLKDGLDFPGLKALPQWGQLKNGGVLSYLFTGNIYELLESIKDDGNKYGFDKFYGQIDKAKSGLKDQIKNGLGTVLDKTAAFTSKVPTSEDISFNGKIGDYKKVVFESNGINTILNTKLDAAKLNNPGWNKDRNEAYVPPEISRVLVTNYDSSSNTTSLQINASHIYQYGSNTMDSFGSTLKLNDNNLHAKRVSSENIKGIDGGYTYNVTYTATVSGRVSENSVVSGDGYYCKGWNDESGWIIKTKNWEYETKTVSNSLINIAWQKDDLNLANIFNFNFGNDNWRSVDSMKLSMADIQRLTGLTIKGYKDDSDKGTNMIAKIKPSMGKSINMQSIAAWRITDLLGVLGVQGFTNNTSAWGALPVADNYTLGGAILELGKVIQQPQYYEALETILHDKKFSYSKFQPLVDLLFGDKPENNFVDKAVDALTSDDLTSSLKDLFGIVDTNLYDAHKIIGALILTFTDGAREASDGTVRGVQGDTTLWNYLTDTHDGVIKQAWDLLNSNDRKVILNSLSNENNFTFENWTTDPKEKQEVTKVTVTVTYKYTWSAYVKDDGKDVSVQSKEIENKYTITWEAGTASDAPGTYTIIKA